MTADALGLERTLVDADVLARTAERLRDASVALPTFAELAEPARIPQGVRAALAAVDPDEPHPLNLFRVHWYNAADRRSAAEVPEHLVLPPALTGIEAPVVVLLGDRFPLIGAHKVLAAYGCLVPRLVTGRFDPDRHRAVWPSTGNYCRGGVAISRLLGCRGVAVLPEGMSRERFDWLERWVSDPGDVIRTPGTESNVKEIYDECRRLAADPDVFVFNQFSEFGNHLVHYAATGAAAAHVFDSLQAERPELRLRAFVSATGSAGTIGAGDYLKERYGSLTAAVEAVECPTLLLNGYGEHNIQGIGDKHVPLIHNVMATDVVVGVSDRASDRLGVLFGTETGRSHLHARRAVPHDVLAGLDALGLSSICNVVAAVKLAKHFGYGPDDAVVTVATDGAAMYASERRLALHRYFPAGFDELDAAEVVGEHLLGAADDHLRELTHEERTRLFNLGYFTWVEQQGIPLAEFEARRDPAFWTGMRPIVETWDALVDEVNARTGVLEGM